LIGRGRFPGTEWCEKTFGKEFRSVILTPAEVSPPIPVKISPPSGVSVPPEVTPTISVPQTAIEESPALQPAEVKPPPPTVAMST